MTSTQATATVRTLVREIPNGPHAGWYRVWCSCPARVSSPISSLGLAEGIRNAHEANHDNYPDCPSKLA